MKEISFEQENIMQRVGFFRNKKNISASELSRSLGHRRNYIYRLEKCEIKLDLSTLQEILEILNVSVSEFFSFNYASYEQDKKFIETFNKLNQNAKDSLFNFLNFISNNK